MMKWQFNQVMKENIITTQSYGAVVKAGVVREHPTGKRVKIEPYTIVKVVGFDFGIKRVIIECTKGLEVLRADVDIDFLMTHCQIETPDPNQEIKAVMVQHVAHNLLDKDTVIFILIMTLTYIVGMVLGKGL